jgi:hypothetical protein
VGRLTTSAALGNNAGSMFAPTLTPSLRCPDRSHMPGPTRPPMIQIVARPAWRRAAESSSAVSGRGATPSIRIVGDPINRFGRSKFGQSLTGDTIA